MTRIILIFTVTLLTIGCGGGSGGGGAPDAGGVPTGGGPAPVPTTTPDTVLGIVLTDAPADDVVQMTATFTRIEVASSGRTAIVFDGVQPVDLTNLADAYEILAVASVPFGAFDLVRFDISDVELVTRAVDGSFSTQSVTLTSPAVIVTPPSGIVGARGTVQLLEVDFDVAKSLELATVDGSGGLTIPPLVFATVHSQLPSTKLVRVRGTIEMTLPNGFRLCDLALPSGVAAQGPLDTCVDVATNTLTSVVGAAADIEELPPGQDVTVIGTLARKVDAIPAVPTTDLPPAGQCREWRGATPAVQQPAPLPCADFATQTVADDSVVIDHEGRPVGPLFRLDAYLVQAPPESFGSFSGTALGPVESGQFEFMLDAQDGFAVDHAVDAVLTPGLTRVFASTGAEVTPDEIQADMKLSVDGEMELVDGDPRSVQASLIAVLAQGEVIVTTGALHDVNTAEQSLVIATDLGEECVDTGSADVLGVAWDVAALQIWAYVLQGLTPVDGISAFGTRTTGDCLVADTILIVDHDPWDY